MFKTRQLVANRLVFFDLSSPGVTPDMVHISETTLLLRAHDLFRLKIGFNLAIIWKSSLQNVAAMRVFSRVYPLCSEMG